MHAYRLVCIEHSEIHFDINFSCSPQKFDTIECFFNNKPPPPSPTSPQVSPFNPHRACQMRVDDLAHSTKKFLKKIHENPKIEVAMEEGKEIPQANETENVWCIQSKSFKEVLGIKDPKSVYFEDVVDLDTSSPIEIASQQPMKDVAHDKPRVSIISILEDLHQKLRAR